MRKFEPLFGFSGIWARELDLKFDDRGHFSEILRQSDLPDGVPNFVQDSISYSKKNTLRGMHLQLNQWQLITLLDGQIVDVLINLDVDSRNYLKSLSMELSWNMLNQVLVEPGFAHGFGVISDVAKIHYKSSVYYGATEQYGVLWNSPEIASYWPKHDWIISDRDVEFKTIKDCGSFVNNK